jgi:hypothetical protein
MATSSGWQLFPGGNFFRVATFSRRQLFPDSKEQNRTLDKVSD